jgi:hypothetical protein
MGLIDILSIINEAELTDSVARGNPVTFESLIKAILNSKEGRVTDKNRRSIANELGIKSTTALVGYIKKATEEGFLNKDGTVAEKYDDVDKDDGGASGRIATSGKISQSLDATEKKFVAPKITNNNLFSKQVFKMLSLMDGQAATSGIKNSLMLTGDPGVGKCLSHDTEVEVLLDDGLYDRLLEKRKELQHAKA